MTTITVPVSTPVSVVSTPVSVVSTPVSVVPTPVSVVSMPVLVVPTPEITSNNIKKELNKYRIICKKKLNEFIKNKDKSNVIENSIYNYTIFTSKDRNYIISFNNDLFRTVYKNKLMNLCLNFDKNISFINNLTFLNNINNNKIDLNTIAFLRPEEIHPEKWNDIIKNINAKKQYELSKIIGTRTKMFKCGRCKKNDTTYYKLQERSCDEPMTTNVHCLNCDKRWKM